MTLYIQLLLAVFSCLSTVESLHLLLSLSLSPSLRGGLLLLTGAQAALQGTTGMIGYGLAKAAVHQLVSSLGAANSGLPPNTSVLAILP